MNSDKVLIIFVTCVWIGSIGLICYLFWALQKEFAKEKQAQIKEKMSDIEKNVANSSIDDLINSNNSDEERKG